MTDDRRLESRAHGRGKRRKKIKPWNKIKVRYMLFYGLSDWEMD